MSVKLTRKQQEEYLAIARKAAGRASRDDQVIGESADLAVLKLQDYWDSIEPSAGSRRGWVRMVAQNEAKRLGARLHREKAMGRAGSLPPPMGDEQADERVALLISEMHVVGLSLGSLVATKVDFERAWALIAEDSRSLLHDKYVEGLTSKEIAEKRGEKPGTVDNKLTAAKKTARLVLEGLIGDLADLDEPV